MSRTKHLFAKFGIVLCGALLGCAAYGQASVSVGVEIRTESDFYEPLTPQGEWIVIGSYGRCWRPAQVEAGWRPYSEGYWQRTDAGWYWVSDEPWAWATYHYGRWNFIDQYGWYWVPQTQWAPAWVSWHSGGGYIGWAPLYPSGVTVIAPGAYVFVEERHFMEPVHRSTVVVNNTTIINKVVINVAPTTVVVEKAIGRKVEAVPVKELRQKTEAAVVSRRSTPAATSEKTVPAAVAAKPATKVETKPVATPESRPMARPETKPAAIPEARPVLAKEPAAQKTDKEPVKLETTAQAPDKNELPAKDKPAANEKNGAKPGMDKDNESKPKE